VYQVAERFGNANVFAWSGGDHSRFIHPRYSKYCSEIPEGTETGIAFRRYSPSEKHFHHSHEYNAGKFALLTLIYCYLMADQSYANAYSIVGGDSIKITYVECGGMYYVIGAALEVTRAELDALKRTMDFFQVPLLALM
jgi:hypothetical protein